MAKISSSGSADFDKLRDYMAKDRSLRNEVRDSLFAMTESINVSDRGSRFVAGGTVEWILASACYAAGVIAIPQGHNANGFDLTGVSALVKGLFSVKSSLSPTSAFRITNGINGAGKGFVEPTIFLHKRLGGMVFADPATHTDLASKADQKADAVVLSLKAIIEHAQQHPECVIDLEIPYNKGRGTYDPALSFAKTLITEGNYPNLKRLFEEVKPKGSTISEEISKLQQMRDDGVLTQDQFERAVDRLLKD
ncbi:SHOCT domain-containing protein [Microbacterium sp. ARD31]|uniref:SHOCT domain-containing protein n=1 Tax=Microbacterium sp. ARD31 TaxID=2962576 RepID=UPI0028816BC3|nr:SHOCT domain-containing protein [Microbacterium sp. ARD31]MDT0184321.1 SHOCT domain-containing protein [Microbacterium sp. ARD31]